MSEDNRPVRRFVGRRMTNDSAKHFEKVKRHFYLVIGGALGVVLALVTVGLVLVYLGANGPTTLEIIHTLKISTTVTGVVCIALAAAVAIIVLPYAMRQMGLILAIRPDR
jgi:hypothetical protein